MIRCPFPLLPALACALTLASMGSAAQEPAGASPAAAPSRIEVLRSRLRGIEAGSLPPGAYHLAKAQAWIDAASDLHHLGNRGPVLDETLAQAERLLRGLEARDGSPPAGTTLIPASARLREDLWEAAARMKEHPGFRCAVGATARFEVQLAMAGHFDTYSGWRHARSYVQAAERLNRQAWREAEECREPRVAGPESSNE